MSFPPVIYVGAARYDVKREDRKLFGQANNRHGRIMVSTRQSDDQARDTLLHEVLHAVLYCSGAAHVLDLENEENLIRLLTPALLAVLRNNPPLVRALTES